MTDLLQRIAKGRIACLKDNEEPRDVLINVELKNQLRREAEPLTMYAHTLEYEQVMGMKIEWVRPGPFAISIRTVKGDVRGCND